MVSSSLVGCAGTLEATGTGTTVALGNARAHTDSVARIFDSLVVEPMAIFMHDTTGSGIRDQGSVTTLGPFSVFYRIPDPGSRISLCLRRRQPSCQAALRARVDPVVRG